MSKTAANTSLLSTALSTHQNLFKAHQKSQNQKFKIRKIHNNRHFGNMSAQRYPFVSLIQSEEQLNHKSHIEFQQANQAIINNIRKDLKAMILKNVSANKNRLSKTLTMR